MQSQKCAVQAEVYAPMEPPEPGVPIEAQKPDKTLEHVGHPPTAEYPV